MGEKRKEREYVYSSTQTINGLNEKYRKTTTTTRTPIYDYFFHFLFIHEPKYRKEHDKIAKQN